eukprot:SM000307S11680  [mRNA]  locus=s307:47101:47747:+ [translate_table: standard]
MWTLNQHPAQSMTLMKRVKEDLGCYHLPQRPGELHQTITLGVLRAPGFLNGVMAGGQARCQESQEQWLEEWRGFSCEQEQ